MIFGYSQYEHSSTATKHGINNVIPEDLKSNIEELDALLTKIAIAWSDYCIKNNIGTAGIAIVSGYRNSDLNSLVGGSQESPHLLGYAADIIPMNKKYRDFFEFALSWAASTDMMFDEIIVEGITGSQWIHVAVRSYNGEQRRKTMKLEGDNLSIVFLEGTSYGYSVVNNSSDLKVIEENLSEESTYGLDWTDENVYNLTPEEVDNVESGSPLFSRNMMLLSRSGISKAEERCLYVMKKLIEKMCISPSQAAGIAGNIAYMTNGTFCTYKSSSDRYGMCLWDSEKRQMFNKLHSKTSLLENSSLREQVEFLVYTMSDRLVSMFQRCYDENSSSNLFFSIYMNNKKWSDLFYGISRKEEEKIRAKASECRAFAKAAAELWNDSSYIDVENIGSYSGNGQDGARMEKAYDSTIYVSDGDMTPVPENEREFSREYIEEDQYNEDPEVVEYYSNLFSTMMG